MKITIEELPASKIAFFRNVGQYGERQNKGLMESFKQWAHLNDLLNQSAIFGIAQDNPEITPKEQCRYDVGIMIHKNFHVSKPAHVGTFSGGKYAVFLLDHTKEAISTFWSTVFSEIEQHQLIMRQEPIIERYTSQMIDNHLCEILVPIQ